MSDPRQVWVALWRRAAADPSPFEISEIAPKVAESLQVDEKQAAHRVGFLLGELERLPEGKQYFAREGFAIVPLAEFVASPKDEATALATYPFEGLGRPSPGH